MIPLLKSTTKGIYWVDLSKFMAANTSFKIGLTIGGEVGQYVTFASIKTVAAKPVGGMEIDGGIAGIPPMNIDFTSGTDMRNWNQDYRLSITNIASGLKLAIDESHADKSGDIQSKDFAYGVSHKYLVFDVAEMSANAKLGIKIEYTGGSTDGVKLQQSTTKGIYWIDLSKFMAANTSFKIGLTIGGEVGQYVTFASIKTVAEKPDGCVEINDGTAGIPPMNIDFTKGATINGWANPNRLSLSVGEKGLKITRSGYAEWFDGDVETSDMVYYSSHKYLLIDVKEMEASPKGDTTSAMGVQVKYGDKTHNMLAMDVAQEAKLYVLDLSTFNVDGTIMPNNAKFKLNIIFRGDDGKSVTIASMRFSDTLPA